MKGNGMTGGHITCGDVRSGDMKNADMKNGYMKSDTVKSTRAKGNNMKAAIHRSIIILIGFLGISLTVSAFGAESFLKRGLDLLRKNPEATESASAALGNDEIIAGLKDALRVGTEKVVAQLGQADGFNKDPLIHIPLPSQLDRVKTTLSRVGMAGTFEDLELKLNRAAESATPVAKDLFLNSVTSMTLTDASGIYKGDSDAATQYFKTSMSPELAMQMQPIVENMLSQVGAAGVLDQLMKRYNAIPLVPKQDINLNEYVVEKAMNGIFVYMAKEEAVIRKNPVARTTELLKKVFGGQ